MEKYNASVSVKTILRAIAMVFALVVVLTMFTTQVRIGSDGHHTVPLWESYFGANGDNGAWASFIGYILVFVGGCLGVAAIFVKSVEKPLALVGAVLAVVGAVLLVLVKVFYVSSLPAYDLASNKKALMDAYKLSGGPIVGCVFAGLTAALLGLSAVVKDAD